MKITPTLPARPCRLGSRAPAARPPRCAVALPRPDPVARAIRGAEQAAFSNEQKTTIILLARSAFRRIGHRAGQPFDEWRREQQVLAGAKPSLRACVNADFKHLEAHFAAIAGQSRRAFRVAVAAQTQDREMARAKLLQECAAAAPWLPDARGYAAGFLRNKRGSEVEDASARDLWHAVFIIRRRVNQLKRAAR
jgi:hypothetical protein